MAIFCKRYLSDMLAIAACLAFGLYLLSEAYREHRRPPSWCASEPSLVLVRQ